MLGRGSEPTNPPSAPKPEAGSSVGLSCVNYKIVLLSGVSLAVIFPIPGPRARRRGMQPVGAVGSITPEIEPRGSFWVSKASE